MSDRILQTTVAHSHQTLPQLSGLSDLVPVLELSLTEIELKELVLSRRKLFFNRVCFNPQVLVETCRLRRFLFIFCLGYRYPDLVELMFLETKLAV